VNKALLLENYAVLYDHNNNEFNPSTWTRYLLRTAIPEFPSFLAPLLLMAVTVIGALLCKKKQLKLLK
jgi:hypothetical protein